MSNALITTPAAADSEAVSIAGSTAVTTARDGGTSLGGSQNQNNLGGEFYATGTGSNITVNGAAGAEALAAKFSETLAQINDARSLDSANTTQLVTDALDKVTQLSESKQTDGISAIGKIALWVVALGVGGWVLVNFFSRSK